MKSESQNKLLPPNHGLIPMGRDPKKSSKAQSLGFTLLEIMVAISVMGALTTTTSLSIVPQLQDAYVMETASTLGFRLQQARAQAVTENRPVEITLDSSAATLVVWQDKNLDGNRDTGEEETLSIVSQSSVSITSDWTSGVFLPSGMFMTLPLSRSVSTVSSVVNIPNGLTREVEIVGSGAVVMK